MEYRFSTDDGGVFCSAFGPAFRISSIYTYCYVCVRVSCEGTSNASLLAGVSRVAMYAITFHHVSEMNPSKPTIGFVTSIDFLSGRMLKFSPFEFMNFWGVLDVSRRAAIILELMKFRFWKDLSHSNFWGKGPVPLHFQMSQPRPIWSLPCQALPLLYILTVHNISPTPLLIGYLFFH